jgi:putative FmdB family regulatory protein
MPIYEYYCPDCHTKFEARRSMAQADDPIECAQCHQPGAGRVLSMFAAQSVGSDGAWVAGSSSGSGCSACSTHHCSTCGSH